MALPVAEATPVAGEACPAVAGEGPSERCRNGGSWSPGCAAASADTSAGSTAGGRGDEVGAGEGSCFGHCSKPRWSWAGRWFCCLVDQRH